MSNVFGDALDEAGEGVPTDALQQLQLLAQRYGYQGVLQSLEDLTKVQQLHGSNRLFGLVTYESADRSSREVQKEMHRQLIGKMKKKKGKQAKDVLSKQEYAIFIKLVEAEKKGEVADFGDMKVGGTLGRLERESKKSLKKGGKKVPKNAQTFAAPEAAEYFAKDAPKEVQARIQNQLYQAGYYGDEGVPTPGVIGAADIRAFNSAAENAIRTGQQIDKLLEEESKIGRERRGAIVSRETSLAGEVFEVTPVHVSESTLEAAFATALGYKPTKQQLDRFAAELRSKEVGKQTAAAQAAVQQQVGPADIFSQPAAGGGGGPTVVETITPGQEALNFAKTSDPTGSEAHDFAIRAEQIFSFLASPVGGGLQPTKVA